ncbi:uncharacterized protein LOC130644580 [Hydractinia symbiolongicarpus]|uniref:uncharacterized protein LOC130644580 n=1 Tax=Hydractinia symbiolongicarpus TaxID=13093 RepID=UPI00254CC883|nr:uncharacterized protein LOC130644580 [Hydractinia symbiolongicarpus]
MCGSASTPCKAFMYAFTQRAEENDCILLDGGGDSHHQFTYHINSSLQINFNITIRGTYPSPVLTRSRNSSGSFPLFIINSSKIVDLCLEGIHFDNISLIYILSDVNLFLFNSTITNNKNTMISFVRKSKHLRKACTIIKDCLFIETRHVIERYITFTYSLFVNNSRFINCSKIFTLLVQRYSKRKIGVADYKIYHSSFSQSKNVLLFSDSRDRKSKLKIYRCSFSNNTGLGVPFIMNKMGQILIQRSMFINNYGSAVGVLLLSSIHKVSITNTKFIKNRSFSLNGGALKILKVPDFFIDKCVFRENRARMSGGAIYKMHSKVWIRNSIFDSNSAQSAGGAIYGDVTRQYLKMENVTMYSSTDSKRVHGSLVNSGNLNFRDVTMVVRPVPGTKYIDGLINDSGAYPGNVDNFTFICPANNKVEFNTRKYFYTLSITCSSCPKGSYSLNNGQIHFIDNSKPYVQSNVTCKKCPNGGMCDDNILTSQGNFWGYVTTGGDVHFIPCPSKYCCKPGKCESYNSCYNHREGRLCGRCEKGYSLDIFSHNCILSEQRNTSIFWIMFIALGFSLTYTLMYLKEITKLFGTVFTKVKKLTQKCRCFKENQCDYASLNESAYDNQLSNGNALELSSTKDTNNLGLLKIFFLFYQTASLLHVPHPMHHGFLLHFKSIVSLIFAFKFMINENLSKLPPLNDMGTIEAVVIEVGFAASLFAVVVVSYLAYLAVKKIRNLIGKDVPAEPTTVTFPVRLKQTFVQLLFLCYIRISSTAFKMIHCTDIREKKYLYVYGDITCYTYWQYIVMLFTIIWVFPFSVAVFVVTKLYAKGQISTQMFITILLFPPLILFNSRLKSTGQQSHQCQFEQENILNVINGPFRIKITSEEELDQAQHKMRINWEAVLIIRRLVLVAVSIFVINPLSRLYLMLPILVLVLLLHLYVKPYHSGRMNSTETVSILLLLILTTVNLFWACDYMGSLTSIAQYDSIVTALEYVEHLIYMSPFIPLFVFCVHSLYERVWACLMQFLRA